MISVVGTASSSDSVKSTSMSSGSSFVMSSSFCFAELTESSSRKSSIEISSEEDAPAPSEKSPSRKSSRETSSDSEADSELVLPSDGASNPPSIKSSREISPSCSGGLGEEGAYASFGSVKPSVTKSSIDISPFSSVAELSWSATGTSLSFCSSIMPVWSAVS